MGTKLFDLSTDRFESRYVGHVGASRIPRWVDCSADEFIKRWLPKFERRELSPCSDEEWRRIMGSLHQSVETTPVQVAKPVERIEPISPPVVTIVAPPPCEPSEPKPARKPIARKYGQGRSVIEECLKKFGPATSKVIADKTKVNQSTVIGVLERNPNAFKIVGYEDRLSKRGVGREAVWILSEDAETSEWKPKVVDRRAYLQARNVTDCDRILEIIKREGRCTSLQIAEALKIDQPKAGNRLRILHEKGLIKTVGIERRHPVFVAVENPVEKTVARGFKNVSLRKQIDDYFKTHSHGCASEIAKAIGGNVSSVRTITRRMYECGELDATDLMHPDNNKPYRIFRLAGKEAVSNG